MLHTFRPDLVERPDETALGCVQGVLARLAASWRQFVRRLLSAASA